MPSQPNALSRQQVRAIDQRAIEELGIPGVVLMENAGLNVARVILEQLREQGVMPPRQSRVAIVCGGGNNAGDGYVIARHLANQGVQVVVVALKDPQSLKGDAAIHAKVAIRLGIEIQAAHASPPDDGQIERLAGEYDMIVDAILGTGFDGTAHGHVREPTASWIAAINHAGLGGTPVLAVDLPSGLDCDTGIPSNPTVVASMTVTFVAPKAGFLTPQAQRHIGRVIVADIGVPASWGD